MDGSAREYALQAALHVRQGRHPHGPQINQFKQQRQIGRVFGNKLKGANKYVIN